MYKKTLIIGCFFCFAWGFSFFYVKRVPLNPDVRATVKALKIGMTRREAIPIMRMSFLLTEANAEYSKDCENNATQVVSTVSGIMPGRAYRYFLKAGFSEKGKLVSIDYYFQKGWLWFFHSNLSPHIWQGYR